MQNRRYAKPTKEREIANTRVENLFSMAEEAFSISPSRSNRYVELARKIAMKFKLRIKPALKRRFCKHCYFYLVPSKNCRVRVSDGKVVYLCLNCKKFMRFPYSKKKVKTDVLK